MDENTDMLTYSGIDAQEYLRAFKEGQRDLYKYLKMKLEALREVDEKLYENTGYERSSSDAYNDVIVTIERAKEMYDL